MLNPNNTEHKIQVFVNLPRGIHARPAAQLVELTQNFQSEIFIKHNGKKASLCSILEILMLTVDYGEIVEVSCTGPDAKMAIEAVEHFFSNPKKYEDKI